jgi:hypothetical protein
MFKAYISAVAALLLILPTFAFADITADLKSRYDAMKTAMAARDGAAIQALLAPDFKSVDINGQTENADQMIVEVQALKPDPNKTSETTLKSVQVNGDKAVVEQLYEMNTRKTGADGQMHAIKLTTQSRDVWKKSADNWLMLSTQTEQMDYTVDGKVIMHKQAQ